MYALQPRMRPSCLGFGIVVLALPLAATLHAAPPEGGGGADYHPRRVLVRFKTSTDLQERQKAHASAGVARPLRSYHLVSGLQLVELSHEDVPRAVAALHTDPNVLYAEPDYYVHATAVPNDPAFGLLWGLRNTGQDINGDPGTPGSDIRAADAWNLWTGDSDFRIAVLDTGVDYAHPDLAGNIWTNPGEIPGNGIDDDNNGYVDDVHGYDFANGDSDPMDDRYHGTHVAGTLGGVANNSQGVAGVSWRCRIVALKFLNASGRGST